MTGNHSAAAERHTVRLSPEGWDPGSTERIPVVGRLRRLLVWYGLATLGAWLTIGAMNSVLLPLQIEDLDPNRKSENLALVATLGALAGMIAQPIAGFISDGTRHRRGRRASWWAHSPRQRAWSCSAAWRPSSASRSCTSWSTSH